ncbi:nuclear membrane fusion protein Kar5 [Stagonosporopsis vannaccii]|nr:nuclear membrane fusion protein Kar5 [Stagonosporopsis vannaccii]
MRPSQTLAFGILLLLPLVMTYNCSPLADVVPTANLDTLFQYSTSRNHKVISQAVDFVVSMQTAPTCTRMAASHLMNECKLLEHAPDFAKSRPDAYLDIVKTEYAAKLAVCELLSTQPPGNASPPQHCDILVPSSRACNKGRWWTQPQIISDKQCYPDYTQQQYSRCLKTLQSLPQYWTSFSNARQNAVVMCQASRDAIERENHLEIFKNLTLTMSALSSSMKHTTDEYVSLLRDQKQFTDELSESQIQFEKDVAAVQQKALATASSLDDKFQAFMDTSVSGLITALANSQSAEIVRIRNEMQAFSRDMIVENSRLAKSLTVELQQHHDRAITSLQMNHAAQVNSYEVLYGYMNDAQNTAIKINSTAQSSLSKMDVIEHQLDNLTSKAEHIAKGFAFLNNLPHFVECLFRGLFATAGALSILVLLYKFSGRLATYVAGACSAAYFLHFCGIYEALANISARMHESQPSGSFSDRLLNLSTTQKGVGVVIVLWLATHPVSRINTAVNYVFLRMLNSYWVRQYSNDGGIGLLPSVEIPHSPTWRKVGPLDVCTTAEWAVPLSRGIPPIEP